VCICSRANVKISFCYSSTIKTTNNTYAVFYSYNFCAPLLFAHSDIDFVILDPVYARVWAGLLLTVASNNHKCRMHVLNAVHNTVMAERQQRQRLRALQNNRQLERFTVQGRATGKQLGTGSYGSVEEVCQEC
jgi:hypothetical protein